MDHPLFPYLWFAISAFIAVMMATRGYKRKSLSKSGAILGTSAILPRPLRLSCFLLLINDDLFEVK